MATTTKSDRATRVTTTTTTTTRTWAERRPVARWLAVLPPLVGLPVLFGLGMGPARGNVEDQLADRTNAALAAEGITGLEAWARGRDIHFRGTASPAAAARAAELASSLRGVRTVFSPAAATTGTSGDGSTGAADAAADADAGLSGLDAEATWRDGKLVLRGSVGSETARTALLAAAAQAVGAANVVDELRLDASLGEADADRIASLASLFSALSERGGEVTAGLGARGVTLEGTAASGADKDALDAAGQQLWDEAGLGLVNRLTIAEPPAVATTVPATTVPATSVPTTSVPTTSVPATTPPTVAVTTPPTTAVANQRFVVYFDVDADLVNAASQATLAQAIAAAQAAAPGAKVTVTGFADSRGSTGYNLELSQRRAARVLEALVVANGALAATVDAKGVDASVSGDLAPARRVEIVFG